MKVTDLFENRPEETQLFLTQVTGEEESRISAVLNDEHTLKLYRGETLLHSFVCSPCDLGALCLGWLRTEGYAPDSVEVSKEGAAAYVSGGGEAPAEPQRLSLEKTVKASAREMYSLFQESSYKHARTHGIHACILKGEGWQVVGFDIGRHNAIDKAVGAAALAGYDLRGAVMFSSGRINQQTVKKAARCGIGCLMSKATVTTQALQLAKELNLQVLFSVKEEKYMKA